MWESFLAGLGHSVPTLSGSSSSEVRKAYLVEINEDLQPQAKVVCVGTSFDVGTRLKEKHMMEEAKTEKLCNPRRQQTDFQRSHQIGKSQPGREELQERVAA